MHQFGKTGAMICNLTAHHFSVITNLEIQPKAAQAMLPRIAFTPQPPLVKTFFKKTHTQLHHIIVNLHFNNGPAYHLKLITYNL